MQDLFSIFDILREPIHQTQLFNPNWEKDHFLEAAIKASGGLKNFGNEVFIEGLEALLSSIRDLKKKHLIGEITLYTLILRSLKNRLQFMNYINKKGFENWSLNTPVIITGVSRSGTTFLHRLLSFNDDFYAFPLWELFSLIKNQVL